jgi:drug/metabolite transporter (DMT)-like permease
MIDTLLVSAAVIIRIVSNPFGNVLQKQLTTKGIHPLAINFLTYLILSLVCILISLFINWPVLPAEFWIYSILGGIAGAFGNGFLIKALQYGELSVLGPVNAYKSVVGMIVGIILLREIPGLAGIIGIALIIWGSYFVLDTTRERFTLALLKRSDIQFRLWAMILTAIEAVFVKKVILLSSTTLAFISWCCFGAFFSFILLFIYRLDIKKETGKLSSNNIGQIALLILCIGNMQFMTNYTFKHMAVGYALSLFQLSTIVSVLLGYRFFREQDIRKKLIGSAIMLIGSVVIILFKNY